MYYHGTSRTNAYLIMKNGFKIGEVMHGRAHGHGVYVCHKKESAVIWANEDGVIIQCELQPGLRVLWIHEEYDDKVIKSLKREFGKDLLKAGPDFFKFIPKNKKLTKTELINFCNYFFEQRIKMGNKPSARNFGKRSATNWRDFPYLTDYIKRYQFDAIGDKSGKYWDSDEIMVFNPSNVKPISAHLYTNQWRDHLAVNVRLLETLSLNNLKFLHDADVKEMEEWMKKWDEDGKVDKSEQ